MEMKELKIIEPIYIEEYDIKVNRYLTYAQVQQIINAVKGLDGWAEREQAIDMLILYHATDIGEEKIEEIGQETLQQSGLIENVKNSVINVYDIYEGLEYTTSTQRALAQILKQLPDMVKKYGLTTKK